MPGCIGIGSPLSAAVCTDSGSRRSRRTAALDRLGRRGRGTIVQHRWLVDQGQPLTRPPLLEGLERPMTGQGNLVEIVHTGPAERTVGDGKTRRFNDVRFNPQAGTKPENRAGILGDVRLVRVIRMAGLAISSCRGFKPL